MKSKISCEVTPIYPPLHVGKHHITDHNDPNTNPAVRSETITTTLTQQIAMHTKETINDDIAYIEEIHHPTKEPTPTIPNELITGKLQEVEDSGDISINFNT